jgi:HK97 gp10 family phage protein
MTEPFLSMQIKGLKELEDELKKLPAKARAKIARKALKEAGEMMKQEVISRTPRKDGFLQASIRSKVTVNNKREQVQIIAGNENAWYAHLIEYGFTHTGHGPKNQRKPTSRGQVEGKAFLRGSAEAKFDSTVDIFEKTVIETVEKELKKTKQ